MPRACDERQVGDMGTSCSVHQRMAAPQCAWYCWRSSRALRRHRAPLAGLVRCGSLSRSLPQHGHRHTREPHCSGCELRRSPRCPPPYRAHPPVPPSPPPPPTNRASSRRRRLTATCASSCGRRRPRRTPPRRPSPPPTCAWRPPSRGCTTTGAGRRRGGEEQGLQYVNLRPT